VKERTSDRYQLPTTNECANLLPAAHLDLVTVLSHLGPRLCQDAPFTYILYFRAVLSGSGWYHLCSTEAYGIRVSNIKHQTTIHPAHTSHPSFLSILPLHPSSPSFLSITTATAKMPETTAAGASKHQLSPSAEVPVATKKPRGRGKGKGTATKAQATPGASDAESIKLPTDVELVDALPEDIVETLKGSKV
jgi:hypothetical protein